MAHRLLIVVLVSVTAAPRVQAEQHIVTPRQVGNALDAAAEGRDSDLAKLAAFLSSPAAQQAARHAGIQLMRARLALPSLTDRELRDLASRIEVVEVDPAAGDAGSVVAWVLVVAFAVLVLLYALAFLVIRGPVD